MPGCTTQFVLVEDRASNDPGDDHELIHRTAESTRYRIFAPRLNLRTELSAL
jgi:hypothetical protein